MALLRFIFRLAAVICIIAPSAAGAEVVLVNGAAQSKGQGWLFGSPRDASCWIAVPRHVVETSKDGDVADFIWRDIGGKEGTGIDVITPVDGLDLAFARVKGRDTGQCLSRLGGNTLTRLIARQPVVEAMSMQRTFVQPHKVSLRSFDKSFVTFEPTTDKAKAFLKPGLSGSPLIFRDPDGLDVPVGLVTQVARDQQSGYAIRFDVIKKHFATLGTIKSVKPKPRRMGDKAAKTPPQSQSYTIIDTTGISESAQTTAEALLTADSCWIARPDNEASSYRAVIVSLDKDTKFSRANFIFDPSCGAAPDSLLIEVPDGDSWSLTGGCEQNDGGASCHFGGRSQSTFRLTVIARDSSPRAIKQLILVP